jgi:hypothetical protein
MTLSDEQLDSRLARFFHAAEGPPVPKPSAADRRRRGRRAVPALAAAALVALLVIVATRHGASSPSRGGSSSSASCLSTLSWSGGSYVGNGLPAAVPTGRSLAPGTAPLCDSSGSESVAVAAIDGVDPQTAVASAADPTIVYIAAGRCAGVPSADALTCLRESLAFGGRRYVATELIEPLTAGAPAGAATLRTNAGARDVRVRSLAGVDPAAAVTTSDRAAREIFVADGVCEKFSLSELRACLLATGS